MPRSPSFLSHVARRHRESRQVQDDEPLAAAIVGERGHREHAVVGAQDRVHVLFDSFRAGPFRRRLLANRDSRPVMVMKPSSSILAMSPVVYQPSLMTLAVMSGRPR